MNLPEKYAWLANVGTLPRTILEGLEFMGVQEVVGRGSNKTIIDWRDILNAAAPSGDPMIQGYSDDDIPWCGLYAAIVTFFRANNITEVVKTPLWARSWVNYGVAARQAALGDVLVFSRNGGGHVGFYIAEDAYSYHVLGGNQSNAVTITRILKNRCIAIRRPPYKTQPSSVKPYIVKSGGAISKNES